MASSKLKKPPALHQKRTPDWPEEPVISENDLSVISAFKKLKVDAEGNYVKKTESQSKESLKHKPESTTTPEDGKETDICAIWSQSLKDFCLCEEGALSKRGRSKWKSMCRYHQLRMRKDNSNSQHSLNLARVVRAHKPVVQESRFRSPDNQSSPRHVLRSPRFTFEMRNANIKEGKGNHPSSAAVTKDSESSKSTGCDETGGGSEAAAAVSERAVFAKAASQNLKDFSSLVPHKKGEGSAADKNKEEPVPYFDHFRDGCDRRRGREESGGQAVACPEENVQCSEASPGQESEASGAAAAASAVSHRAADLTVERSCSQEACLDEMECSVNDLTGYMEHYLFIPKNMSSMAQMMYA